MKKPEPKLWHNLRDNTKTQGVFWTRLESWAIPGVPDLHGIVDGHAFWLELKVHRLKSLKSINLSPHQILWQTQYSSQSGHVWNLVHHLSSSSLKLFGGWRARQWTESPRREDDLIPDFETRIPYDWTGIINHILSSSPRLDND